MGVKVTRKFEDGTKNTREYVCFGFLANIEPQNANVVEVDYHFSHGISSSNWGKTEDYLKEMANIFHGNPLFKYCSIHPRKGVITVKNVPNIPCDHLMACLFAMRNMAQNPNCIETYKWCRAVGFSPIVSFTVCNLFRRKKRIGPLDRPDTRWSRWGQSEGSIFHQATFGELAFKRMIRQGYSKVEFNPWKQEPFTDQRRYLRDSDIHREFGYVSHVLNDLGVLRPNGRETQHANYMAFCFSDFSGKEKELISGKNTNERLSDEGIVLWLNSMLPKRFQVNVEEALTNPDPHIPEHLRIGSRVRMTASATSRYPYETNPNNTTSIGTIASYQGNRFVVQWIEEGYENTYLAEDLQSA